MNSDLDPAGNLHLPLMPNLATRAADGGPRDAPVRLHREDGARRMPGSARNAPRRPSPKT